MRNKLLAAVISIILLVVLIISGPANAFVLSIELKNPSVYSGEKVSFIISAETENNETSIDYLILSLEKTNDKTISSCKFDINGNILEGCSGIQIQKISESYSYGYHYLESVSFNITLDTSFYKSGVYKTGISLFWQGEETIKKGPSLNIKASRKGISSCSIRGSGGELTVEEKSLGKNNKINFYIPLENAVNGEGYLTGQKDKERFTYEFEVIEVLSNNEYETKILVSGKYTLGKNEKFEESVILLIKSGKISLDGENISLEDMKITFQKGC